MKVEANKPSEFIPVTINITLESEHELCMFFSIFNHSKILESAGLYKDGRDIRRALEINSNVKDVYDLYFEKFSKELNRICGRERHE